MLIDNTKKLVELEVEVAGVKAMQTKLIDLLAQVITEREFVRSPTTAAALTIADVKIKLAGLSEEILRLQNQINNLQIATDYTDNRGTSPIRTEQYRGRGSGIPLTSDVGGSSDADSGKTQVSKAPISTMFPFGTTPATSVAAQPATGFVFGQTVNTPSTLAPSPPKVTFAAQCTTDHQKHSIPELSAGITFGSPQQHEFSFKKRPSIQVRTREIAFELSSCRRLVDAQLGVYKTPVQTTPKIEQSASEDKPRVLFEETVDAGESSAVSSSDSVEIIKVEKASEADVRRARELMLPEHFFLYESRQSRCKGCRGCENGTEEESPATAENDVAVKPKKVSQSTEKPAPTVVKELTSVKLEQPTITPPKAAPVFGAPPAFGTVSVEQTRNENLKPLEASPTTADSGFVFGAGSTMSFSALAASSASSGFAKPSGENPWSNSSQPTSFFSAFSKTGASNANAQGDDGAQAEDTDEVEPSKDIHFEPVIPMPELITVQTGEEQDEVLYSQRAKLYVYHAQTSEWRERAIGNAKILRCPDGRARIVVRRDTVHKVACNHHITDSMELKPLSTATNSVTWSAVDSAENDPTPQLFALKVKTEARLNDFKKIFEEEVERARKAKEGKTLEQEEKPYDVGEDLKDFEIVECGPDGVVTARTEASEDKGGEEDEYVYEKGDDEEAGDEDSDTYFDDDDIYFTALVTFSEEVPIGENQWTNLGPGILRVLYDDEAFGYVIHLSDQETDTVFAETIIAVQTSLRETGRKGIWIAMDTKQKPSVRRRFCAEFTSDDDLKNFSLVFNEGKETALQTGIVENCDHPPWTSPKAPSSSRNISILYRRH